MKRSTTTFLILAFLYASQLMATEFHVSKHGDDGNPGSVSQPFLTISKAAELAMPGDIITVHTGTYREWINPRHGGESDSRRIIYRTAAGEKVEIKGSEIISGWKKQNGNVWKVTIPNTFFGDYNPYQDTVHGDWFHRLGRIHHTGEVFLNGQSLYEKESMELVRNPQRFEKSRFPENSLLTWYSECDEEYTRIWANFQGANPNRELVEISTRRTCFYPSSPGINYLTINGFEFSQAATQWGAPTAEQIGMIATHWNKGWIIENCVIHDSKCSGITLGKERGTGHNVWSEDEGNINRDGNIHYIEVVFNVLRNNWDKDHIGSHIVRNNQIYNCEQTGICGSMGAVFSLIENNHIYNIWTKRQFSGYEIAGIKFHAPVDATLRNNTLHNCGRGIWLDWMVQGTRVSSNLLFENDLEDLFIEVSHGPYIVDNNLLLSAKSIKNWSQGGAFLHNLFAGGLELYYDPNRFTPYFLPHSIEMAGLTTISGGDDRFYNNVFFKSDLAEENQTGGLQSYKDIFLPLWFKNNAYFNGALPSMYDEAATVAASYDPELRIVHSDEHLQIQMLISAAYFEGKGTLISSEMLGKAKISKGAFDDSDKNPLIFDLDFFGKKRDGETTLAGPFAKPETGEMIIDIW